MTRVQTREELATEIIENCLAMNARGINQGSAGNISARFDNGFLITPSGMAYEHLKPEHIVLVDLEGHCKDSFKPSSEWRMHRDIYTHRAEAGAVLHAHSTFATTLSCLRKDIPAFHYMIAVAGGADIRCSEYALFGTQALSEHMLVALKKRRACLLGTHGMICFHDNLDKALWLGVEVESLAKQYWHALQIGDPVILSAVEMADVLQQFRGYGKQPAVSEE